MRVGSPHPASPQLSRSPAPLQRSSRNQGRRTTDSVKDSALSDKSSEAAVARPAPKKKPHQGPSRPKRQPRYHVILWDDDDHSYDYVIRMMQQLFGHQAEKGYEIAKAVDSQGRAICLTTTMEHAELKRDQIHAFGKDDLIARCSGSMSASIEPER